jgi:hypothetical protein
MATTDQARPDAVIDMADVVRVAEDMANLYGVKGRKAINKLATMLAFDAVANDPGLAFRRDADKQSPHRVIVAFIETDDTVTKATLAHVRSQSAMWNLKLRLHQTLHGALEAGE